MNQDSNSIAKALKVVSIIVFAVGFIFGIGLADTHQMLDLSGRVPEYVYNWPLMVGVWAISAIIGIGFLGFSQALFLLEKIANNTVRIPSIDDDASDKKEHTPQREHNSH